MLFFFIFYQPAKLINKLRTAIVLVLFTPSIIFRSHKNTKPTRPSTQGLLPSLLCQILISDCNYAFFPKINVIFALIAIDMRLLP